MPKKKAKVSRIEPTKHAIMKVAHVGLIATYEALKGVRGKGAEKARETVVKAIDDVATMTASRAAQVAIRYPVTPKS